MNIKSRLEENENLELIKIIIFGLFLVASIIITHFELFSHNIIVIINLILYLIVAFEIFIDTIHHIIKLDFLNEDFLMSIASIGAFVIGDMSEAIGIMFFFILGEFIEDKANDNSKEQIKNILDLRPDFAWKKTSESFDKVDPATLQINDIIMIKPSEKIPVDGIIVEGNSYIDNSMLTGESKPVFVDVNAEVLSGSVNINSVIYLKVTKKYEDSTASRILDIIDNSTKQKSSQETFISKFAKVYTPVVIALALIIAIVPSIITKDFHTWIYRGISFLVVSCPCAILLSVPLTFYSGVGILSKNKVLVKGSIFIEKLSRIKNVFFDKTGTLTKGEFKIINISTNEIAEDELLKLFAYAEYNSTHPIALLIKNKYQGKINESDIINCEQVAGLGVVTNVVIDGVNKKIIAGNAKMMGDSKIDIDFAESTNTVVYLALNGKYMGKIEIGDIVKEDSINAVSELKELGFNINMLTGDNKQTAESVAKQLGIDNVYSQLLPEDKLEIIKGCKEGAIFVGDGINDAPGLIASEIGMSMGELGNDYAINSSDVIIMNDKLSRIPLAVKFSRKIINIAIQNIVFSILVKILIMLLIGVGIGSMWIAVFGDVGVMIITIFNSLRVLLLKDK